MEKNPVTHTLFRFVSYRGVQLADANTRTRYFATLQNSGGFFQTEVPLSMQGGLTKAEALRKAAEDFPSSVPYPATGTIKSYLYQSEKDLEKASPILYQFSIWIVRNRTTYINAELTAQLQRFNSASIENVLVSLWDNFFYRLVAGNAPSLLESISQMLVASHVYMTYGKSLNNLPDVSEDILDVSVTLPPSLFDTLAEVSAPTPGDLTARPAIPSASLRKKLIVTEEQLRLTTLEVVREALVDAQADHQLTSEAAYQDAEKQYQTTVAQLWEDYRQQKEQARASYCSSTNLPREYNPNDPCQQPPYVPEPTIPDFSFTYDAEVTPTKLQGELSADAYNTLLGVLGYNFNTKTPSENQLFRRYKTYDSLLALVDKETTRATANISQNATLSKRSVRMNGVSFRVSNMDVSQPFEYEIYFSSINNSKVFTLLIGVPDNSWQISHIKVTGTKPNNTVFHHDVWTPAATFNGNAWLVSSFYTYTASDLATAPPVFEFELTFSDTTVKRITGILITTSHGTKGYAVDPTEVEEPTTGSFIPVAGGFRNIGSADYLKLEQTVHCYVEGEVSHIENIMAREYKEKATRILRRNEQTTTTSAEREAERLSDTTSTDRFEMQSEIGQVISQTKDFAAFANTSVRGDRWQLDAGINTANNNNRENSIHQMTTVAKEVTERAMDRVVQKIKEERVVKILEEYEENNKHGFDNREGSQHVVGVYRWVDKLYKNQIQNYGTRMMLEFMVPEPATLHVAAMAATASNSDSDTSEFEEPVDPRTIDDSEFVIAHPSQITPAKASYWAGIYNAEIEAKPLDTISVGDSFNIKWDGTAKLNRVEANAGNAKIAIPDGYVAKSAVGTFTASSDNDSHNGSVLSLTVGTRSVVYEGAFSSKRISLNTTQTTTAPGANPSQREVRPFSTANYTKDVPVSFLLGNHVAGEVNVTVTCDLSDEGTANWQNKTFKAIMDAYEDALAAFREKTASQQTATAEVLATNPNFYRQIENTILRKNCISYLLDRTTGAQRTYGRDFLPFPKSFDNGEVELSGLGDYASFVQFMEQAFEWDIMSYNFYPYYWGSRSRWTQLYTYDGTDDPIFRAFMQSGMARVIVTVRPGFEDAVGLYLSTGILWNGGRVPVLGDPLFVSLIDEVKRHKPKPYGKAWLTRVPTSLTILQADSIGLKVEKALPCNCDDVADFEPGTKVPCGDSFEVNTAQLGYQGSYKIRFLFADLDTGESEQEYTMGYYASRDYFPRKYECMGHEITIHREADWTDEKSVRLIFEKLAQQLSLIEGVQAGQFDNPVTGFPDGIRFTIDVSVVPNFEFIKKKPTGVWSSDFDRLKVVHTGEGVQIQYGRDGYGITTRLFDKNSVALEMEDANVILPLSRFKV